MIYYCYKPGSTYPMPMIIKQKPIPGIIPYMTIEIKDKQNATNTNTTADSNTPSKHE